MEEPTPAEVQMRVASPRQRHNSEFLASELLVTISCFGQQNEDLVDMFPLVSFTRCSLHDDLLEDQVER